MIPTLTTAATPGAIDWFKAATAAGAALVWPVVVIVLALVFRSQIVNLFRTVREFRGPGFTAKFDREIREVGAELKFDKASADIDEQIAIVAFATSDNRQPPDSEVRRILLSQYLEERANENPLNALLEAYIAIERWYDRALLDRKIDNFDGTRKLSVTEMAGIAVEKDLLPASSLNLIDGLTVMRSLALAESPDRVTPDQAREFLSLADGTLYTLDTELRKSGAKRGEATR